MLYKRRLLKNLTTAKKSILLLGPRQTGKSTLIRQLDPNLEINLADEEVFFAYSADPGRLKRETEHVKTVFIDEVQRLPGLLNSVQAILDRRKDVRFFLTGSSARKLRRGKANLLPGRIFSYELGPLSLDEIPAPYNLEEMLAKGLLPEPYASSHEEFWRKLLRSYASTYLKEEIQAEALTRNIEGFSRFFQVMASRSGDFVDISKYASAAMVDRSTARRFFEILEDTLVVYTVDPFTRSSRRRLVQHPRYYFFDVGVLNGILGNFSVSPDRIGNLFEHLVLQLLKSAFKANDEEVRISVYRTDGGAEVDFIVERQNQVFAVEVKASKTLGTHDLRGLSSFSTFFKKPHTPMILFLGERKQSFENGIVAWPWAQGIAEITSS
jgi:predicted AAA+ superfamily ATPase